MHISPVVVVYTATVILVDDGILSVNSGPPCLLLLTQYSFFSNFTMATVEDIISHLCV